ncbi:Uncharacterized protein DAT39_001802, partial [Clarias magur]
MCQITSCSNASKPRASFSLRKRKKQSSREQKSHFRGLQPRRSLLSNILWAI